MTSRRLLAAVILQFLAIVIALFSLLDPLEGGFALVVFAGVMWAIWALSRVRIPRLQWVSLVVAVACAVTILLVFAVGVGGPQGVSAQNPLSEGIRAFVWVYRAAAFAMVAGAAQYLGALVAAYRE
ncbi:hypothetical protein C8A06_1109 [Microbacteriaceae bacterium MWH-Ta3]|nr:hypothetical protein C8A06_1109 [Microbacteriaceae bacterium MWH-Ta3]